LSNSRLGAAEIVAEVLGRDGFVAEPEVSLVELE